MNENTGIKQDLALALRGGNLETLSQITGGMRADTFDDFELWQLLVLAAFLTGSLEPGKRWLRKGMQQFAGTASQDICLQLADTLGNQREFLAASRLLEAWVESTPEDANAWNALGSYRFQLHDTAAAKTAFNHALHLDEHFIEARYNLATVLAAMGDADAAAVFTRAFQALPACGAVYNYALNTRFENNDPRIDQLEQSLEANKATETSIALRFALGKAHDDAGNIDAAFGHIEKGNALQHNASHYDSSQDRQKARQLIDCISQSWVSRYAGAYDAPLIFIVGMPRSGSTLVERILGGHSQVCTLGETFQFQAALADATATATVSSPTEYAKLLGERVDFIARRYTQRLAQYLPDKPVITDKTLHNFWHVGIIAAIFPHARFIYCQRDPADLCFANYRQWFQSGEPWAYDLSDIASYHALHLDLMDHWRQLFPGRIHSLANEALVKDSESEIKGLLAFCELDPEPGCFDTRGNNLVQTLSTAQVREPINARGIGKWRKYAQYLQPLLDSLGADSQER